jgi:type III pantothenate kinase
MKEELGQNTKVIGTGGYAELIGRETTMIDHVNPQLTLEGLRMIHALNKA